MPRRRANRIGERRQTGERATPECAAPSGARNAAGWPERHTRAVQERTGRRRESLHGRRRNAVLGRLAPRAASPRAAAKRGQCGGVTVLLFDQHTANSFADWFRVFTVFAIGVAVVILVLAVLYRYYVTMGDREQARTSARRASSSRQ